MSQEKVERLKDYVGETVSINTPVGEDKDSTLEDYIPDKSAPTTEELYEKQEEKAIIDELLSRITDERTKMIMKLRFGFIDGRVWTLEEIGAKFNITRERVRQIESKTLHNLKN